MLLICLNNIKAASDLRLNIIESSPLLVNRSFKHKKCVFKGSRKFLPDQVYIFTDKLHFRI